MPEKQPVIMVIEDEALLLEAITAKIKTSGMEAVSCKQGAEALNKLKSMEQLPAAIWLDYYLKGELNGLDFLREVKSNEAWRAIPVVVVGNTASEDKVNTMLALGANKYLLKAEHPLEEIVTEVKSFISTP